MQVVRLPPGNMSYSRSYRSGKYLPCLADLDRAVGTDHTDHTDHTGHAGHTDHPDHPDQEYICPAWQM